MSYLTKAALAFLILGCSEPVAEAASLCKPDSVGITLIAGKTNPPGTIDPDTEKLKEAGVWPTNLIEQGWHNLRKAARPLTLVCRYKGRPDEVFLLPEKTDACTLRYIGSGLVFACAPGTEEQ